MRHRVACDKSGRIARNECRYRVLLVKPVHFRLWTAYWPDAVTWVATSVAHATCSIGLFLLSLFLDMNGSSDRVSAF